MFKILKQDIEKDSKYLKSVDFWNNFDYKNSDLISNSDFVLEQSKHNFELATETMRRLDSKSDFIIVCSGVIIGLLSLYTGNYFGSLGIASKICVVLSISSLLVSIGYALSIKMPFDVPHPPNTESIFKYLKDLGNIDAARAKTSIAYYRANTALFFINRIKGLRLRSSYIFLIMSLIIIGFGLILQSFYVLFFGGLSDSVVHFSASSSCFSSSFVSLNKGIGLFSIIDSPLKDYHLYNIKL